MSYLNDSSLTVTQVLNAAGFIEPKANRNNIARLVNSKINIQGQIRAGNYPDKLLDCVLEMIEIAYLDDSPITSAHAGTVLKHVAAELYCLGGANGAATAPADVEKMLVDLIFRVALLQQIDVFEQLLIASSDLSVTFTKNGFKPLDERTALAYLNHGHATVARGRALRTLKNTNSVMTGALTFLAAIQAVCAGRSPADVDVFAGTAWADFPPFADPQAALLWEPLLNLSNLVIVAARAAAASGQQPHAIVQLDPAAPVDAVHGTWSLKHAANLCWAEQEVRQRLQDWPANLIVEKPVITRGGKWQTSARLLMESIIWHIENSVLAYDRPEAPPWAQRCRHKFVAIPFEDRIVDLMRAHGFEAGSVKYKDQIWYTGAQEARLTASKALPGEIDCLAIDRANMVGYILECKVLNEPYRIGNAEQRHQKLTGKSATGFQTTLTNKRKWVESLAQFKGIKFIGRIVVDRPIVEMFDPAYPNMLLSPEFLPTFLDHPPSTEEHRQILRATAEATAR
jgi:hypothetical protein